MTQDKAAMSGNNAPPAPKSAKPSPRPPGERSPGTKLIIAVAIATVLMVPLLLIYGLVWDRQTQAETAQASIGQGWGGSQTISAPVLVVPYRTTEQQTTTENGREITRAVSVIKSLFLSPVANDATVELDPELRRKAIYATVVYTASIDGKARFELPADLARYGIEPDALLLERAELRMGVSDARGLVDGNRLVVNGQPVALQPGKGLRATNNSGTFAFVDWTGAAPMAVDYRIAVRGLGDFRLVPRGIQTRWQIASPWASPSFGGDFLPNARDVRTDGFTADYRIVNLALGQAQVMTDDLSAPNVAGANRYDRYDMDSGEADGGQAKAVTISLLEPVDLYSQVNRALKYGFLFIGFTFVTFLMFDIIAGARVAAAEYFLTGIALVLFFVLLLAFAEMIGFMPAYLLASAGIIGLLSAYSAAILKSWKRARLLAALLTGLYALLYVLLNLEAYALVIGSVLMFAALAAVMYLTRGVDWGGLGKKADADGAPAPKSAPVTAS